MQPHNTTNAETDAVYLVRYGVIPEVARIGGLSQRMTSRGTTVVVETDRGLQLGTVLERLKPSSVSLDWKIDSRIVRDATAADIAAFQELSAECEKGFHEWCERILHWKLQLELIDLEWTLDRQCLILYVLCERGPDSTQLALRAESTGLGKIEVQPVSANGLSPIRKESIVVTL